MLCNSLIWTSHNTSLSTKKPFAHIPPNASVFPTSTTECPSQHQVFSQPGCATRRNIPLTLWRYTLSILRPGGSFSSPLASPYNPSLPPLVVRSKLTSLVFLLFIAGTNSQPFSYISILYLFLSSSSFFLYCSDTEKFDKAITTLTAMAFTLQLIVLTTDSLFRQMRPRTETAYTRTFYFISIGSAILTTTDIAISMSFDVLPVVLRIRVKAEMKIPFITTLDFLVTWIMWIVDFMVMLKTEPAKRY
jgi:hypothetical protein